MKTFTPSQTRELLTGAAALLLSIAASLTGIIELARAALTPLILVWIFLPLLGLPLASLVLYRMYGLLSSQYSLDRNGFYLSWGIAVEHIPISKISAMAKKDLSGSIPTGWRSLLGNTGIVEHAELGRLELFCCGDLSEAILIRSESGSLLITPSDADIFLRTYLENARKAALQRIKPVSIRPDFLISRLLNDKIARWILPAGLVVQLLLLGAIVLLGSALPELVAFGFDVFGNTQILVPSGRLLLLPLAGSAAWLLNFAAGIWFFQRDSDRVLSYILWGSTLFLGVLLWISVFYLLSTSPGWLSTIDPLVIHRFS